MTFLTVNYCKGISTIIHKQNNENGVLRIYHLSESTVIGALKEIKFQFMYVNFVYNKNVNRIFMSSKIRIKFSKYVKYRRRTFILLSLDNSNSQCLHDFKLHDLSYFARIKAIKTEARVDIVWEWKTHSFVFILLYKSKLGFLFPFWYIDQLNTFNNIFIYFMRLQ